MPKKNTSRKCLTKGAGDLGMPQNERAEAVALLASIRSENPDHARKAAQQLVETAVYLTFLVEVAWYFRPGMIAEASKDYSFFPILLASRAGCDTKQKLNRIENLPIGENLPFKRLRGAARNDNLRFGIEGDFRVFQRVRQGLTHLVDSMSPSLESEIKRLPELSAPHARKWAAAMVRLNLEGPGGGTFLSALGIGLHSETKKRKQRKEDRVRAKFGGTKVAQIRSGSETRFVAHSGNVAKGREVDAIEATRIESRMAGASNTAPTAADQRNSLIDEIGKRICSMLK